MTALSNDVIRATAAHYNKAKGNYLEAARAAGISKSTFQGRVEIGKKRNPSFFQTFETARGGAPSLASDVQTATWNAFVLNGFNAEAGARSVSVPGPTFKHRLHRYAEIHKIDLTKLRKTTLKDDLHSYKVSESEQSTRARYKDAVRTISELTQRMKDMEWAVGGSFQPAEWSTPKHTPRKREHTPYLFTSDFQIGEVIRAEETDAGYGYDSDIFRNRYRRMIDTTIYLSFEHAGSLWKYPGIIYVRGGDTISGGIHEELRETDDLTPIEACECAFEEESAGITKLADAFGRVEVKAPGAAGNHDRTTFKPGTKNTSAHSYDRIIGYMLRRHFKSDSRVNFQVSESFDVRFPIYDKSILVTHGDRTGSRGGQGFIGPAATILRGAQKVIMEQAALGFHIDRVDTGHYHYPFYMDWALSNGCLPGYSEYAKSFRMRPTPPTQMLLYHHPKRGVVDIKPINLTEA